MRYRPTIWRTSSGGTAYPSDPAGALRSQVSRLRKILPLGAPLVTEEGGFACAWTGRSRRHPVRRLLVAAGNADGQRSLDLLDEALRLWRGTVLEEFADRPFAQPEARRLEELHGSAREQQGEHLLGARRPADAAAAMEALITEQPEREHARALLMEALYRLGRQTEALDVYQSWRRRLGEEHGLEPSPALRRLEDILQHAVMTGRCPARTSAFDGGCAASGQQLRRP